MRSLQDELEGRGGGAGGEGGWHGVSSSFSSRTTTVDEAGDEVTTVTTRHSVDGRTEMRTQVYRNGVPQGDAAPLPGPAGGREPMGIVRVDEETPPGGGGSWWSQWWR